MPEGVTYTKRADAEEYAESVSGIVVPVEKTKGITEYNVIVPPSLSDEPITRGPTTVIGKTGTTSVDYEGSSTRNMGGIVEDELGYMNGGVIEDTERGPIKYSKGGAVKGKTFRGSY